MDNLTVNGQKVFIDTGAQAYDPNMPVAVLLHGAGMDHRVWLDLRSALIAQGYFVLVPDLPAHGMSAGRPLASIDEMAGWLDVLLGKVGIAHAVHIIGHSMGGLTGLHFAAENPDKVKSLVLLGVAARMSVNSDLLSLIHDEPARAVAMIVGFGWDQDNEEADAQDLEHILKQCVPPILYADMKACDDYQSGAEKAAMLRMPALVIGADKDRLTPAADCQALAELMQGGEYQEIRNCGHMMMLEHPKPIQDAVSDFLK